MKKVFKRGIAVLLMLVMLVSLVACGNPAASDKPAANSDKKVVLQVFAGCWQEIPANAERLFAAYTAEHPNVTFELTPNEENILETMVAAKNYPDLAVMVAFSPIQAYADHLYDFTNETEILAEINESALGSVTKDGKIIGVPLNSESYGLIYNKDLLAEAGYSEPPKTISEFKKLCENLKANGVTPLGLGFKEGWILDQFINFPFHDKDIPLKELTDKIVAGELNIGDTQYYKDFQAFMDLCMENCDDPLETDYTAQVTLFAAGDVAMISNGDWTSGMITEINPDINMGMMGFPYSNNEEDYLIYNNASNSITAFKDAKNTDAALDFIKWLVTSETGKTWIGQDWCVPGPVKGTNAKINPLSADGIAADEGGYSCEWGSNYIPAGSGDELGIQLQKYIMGEVDWQTVCDKYTAAIVEFGNK